MKGEFPLRGNFPILINLQVLTQRSGCPLITLCGGSFSQEKPTELLASFILYKLRALLKFRLIFDLTIIKHISNLSCDRTIILALLYDIKTLIATNCTSIIIAGTNPLGFSWEKLPPQRVMRGHPESFVRTRLYRTNHIIFLFKKGTQKCQTSQWQVLTPLPR